MNDARTIVIDSLTAIWNHDMKRNDFIEQVVGQEALPGFHVRKGAAQTIRNGNLSVRFGEPGSERRMLYFYEACLWGAQFHEVPTPYETKAGKHVLRSDMRPHFEFVNVGKYSASTSSNQSDIFRAVRNAPRRYTPCLVIVPIDTGGFHWSPPDDWTGMQVALDFCRDNGRVSDFRGPPAQWGDVALGRQLARTFNADAFWLLETDTRTP